MKFDPKKHRRRSVRVPVYDYSQPGAYFITAVAYQRQCLFGDIVDGKMRLNKFGKIAEACWHEVPDHFRNVELGTFVVILNHVHGIIVINKFIVGAQHAAPLQTNVKPGSLGAVVRSYKSAVTKRINEMEKSPGAVVWQRNYYEHIIRNETEWNNIHLYIESNPINWDDDDENPTRYSP